MRKNKIWKTVTAVFTTAALVSATMGVQIVSAEEEKRL